MKEKICLIYNYAQHYRTNIFKLLNDELHCDFVFGDKLGDIKKMDYALLSHFKKEVKNVTFLRKPIYYQKGVLSLLKENYTTYLMLGEIYCLSTWLMLFRLKVSRKKIYLWSHGWYGRESVVKTIVKKIFFSLADGTFLYGNYAKDLMLKEGIKEEKLHVIYNSLDYDRQLLLRKTITTSKIFHNRFQNENRNLIFVGRLTKTKRLDLLIYAVKKLKSEFQNYNVTLIGDGEEKETLIQLVKKLNLEESFWFYGPSYCETELSELIYNADMCISPGNIGLTAMHSMVYGTPVITHNDFAHQMPEFEAISDGLTGAFFKINDFNSLAEVVSHWFSRHIDREFIRKQCYRIIDTKYNPYVQIELLKKYLL